MINLRTVVATAASAPLPGFFPTSSPPSSPTSTVLVACTGKRER